MTLHESTERARRICPWDFPSKDTGLSCHVLLQGIVLTGEWTHISCFTSGLFTAEPPGKRVFYLSWKHFFQAAAAAAKSLQSRPNLCDPIDSSPPGSPIPGILQARTLEWVAVSFSKAWKGKGKAKSPSHVQLLATPWIAAHQTPWEIFTSCLGRLEMDILRLIYWDCAQLSLLRNISKPLW